MPFFEAIPADKYGRLAELCRVKNYEPNTVLFREGDIGNRFYIIAHGTVKILVTKRGKDGKDDEKIEVARMGAGRYFGEIALVTNGKFGYSVFVVTLPFCEDLLYAVMAHSHSSRGCVSCLIV